MPRSIAGVKVKTAIVHDWLMSIGGGEKVLQQIYDLFPSPIYTLVANQKKVTDAFPGAEIISSFVQKVPFVKRLYMRCLPLFPFAIEQFNLSSYDLILSHSHCVAKGVVTGPNQLHICYCSTPMRYAWDLYHPYLSEAGLHRGMKGLIAKSCLHYLRMWDVMSAQRVDAFIANSKFVAARIRKFYGREATVIYPGVDTDFYSMGDQKKSIDYITASRFVSYKKIDLIVEAFSHLPDRKLIVIGDGPEEGKIKRQAKKNVEFIHGASNEELRNYLRKAKAFIFAAVEDFGIAPIEAMACGTPVIALRKGSLRETAAGGITGLFFEEQTVPSLIAAIDRFEKLQSHFNPETIRAHALRFSKERFRREYQQFVEAKWQEHQTALLR